jgi:PAS domain S-box-containing protein
MSDTSAGASREAPLRLLLLEDSRFDAELLRQCVQGAYPGVVLEVVADEDAFIERVERGAIDVILSDYELPGFTGAQALQHARVLAPDTPFIFVSGVIGEDNAVEMLKQGATDYVSKSRLSRLPMVMDRALREVEQRRARDLAEARLREADALFARVVDSLRDHAVLLLDRDGAVKTWNRAAHTVFGLAPDAPPGTSASVLYMPEDQLAGTLANDLRDALAHGKGSHSRWMMRTDGGRFWAESTLTPLQDSAGAHSGYSMIVRDATGAHRDAEALRLAKESAERANHAKDRFLAVLSHELRTPLAPIAAAADTLARRADVPEKYGGLLPMIKRNVALEARLIDDLLDLTAISAGKISMKRTSVDMHALVRSVTEMVEHDARAKHQRVVLELRATAHCVEADEARMQQVLWNLVRNAIKFTPDSGEIRIATGTDAAGFVLTCSDSGIGIDAESLPRIFSAFEQAGHDIGRRYGGLGLGLAIAKGLVDQMHGSLAAASPGAGRGSTFTLRMPIGTAQAGAPATAEAPPAAAASATTAAQAHRLLLVEDNLDAAEAMALSLEACGYDVTHAKTKSQALALAEGSRFDIVLTDLGLPDGSGIDVGRALSGSVPVVALSGYGTPQDVRESTTAGFSGHLVKPVDPMVVFKTIEKILAERSQA